MSGWSDYALSDFVLFSPEVYWRLFALENAALFPWSVVAPLGGLVCLLMMRRAPRGATAALCLLLAAGWAVAGASFLWTRYGAINWAAPYAAPLYAAAALLLPALCLSGRAAPPAPGRAAGLALLAFGLVVYPLLALVFGRAAMTAELAGVAPDPTAAATLGLSFFLRRGPLSATLQAVAALWLATSALTLYALGEAAVLAPLFALALWGVGAVGARAARR